MRRPTRRRRPDVDVGDGLWRRVVLDCESIARREPSLVGLLPPVRVLAATGHRLSPSSDMDVPADPAARALHERLQAVRQALREAEYRARLLAADPQAPDAADQLARYQRSVATAQRLLPDEEPGGSRG